MTEFRARRRARPHSGPERVGPYDYTLRPGVADGDTVTVRRTAGGGPEELVLDYGALRNSAEFCEVAAARPSPDGRWIVYQVDRVGDERYSPVVREIATQTDRWEGETDLGIGICWTLDSQAFFAIELDGTNRPFRVVKFDVLCGGRTTVWEEADPTFEVYIRPGRSGQALIISSSSRDTYECWLLSLADPTAEAELVRRRTHGVKYSVDHLDDGVLMQLEESSGPVLLRRAQGSSDWREVYRAEPGRSLGIVVPFETHALLFERMNNRPSARSLHWQTGEVLDIEPPEAGGEVRPNLRAPYRAARATVSYSSPTVPHSNWLLDLTTGGLEPSGSWSVADYDPSEYASEQIRVPTSDGAEVPVSLVWHRDRKRPGPLVLQVYGAYGISTRLDFDTERLSLLDRGICWAVAHVRGGGELGSQWHEAGRRERKLRSIEDFESCHRHLLDTGWADERRIAWVAASAGALVVGAALNRPKVHPPVALVDVPFVDPVATLSDLSLPSTANEHGEWGDPRDPMQREWIAAYDPCLNVRPQSYPDMLVTAAVNDGRVPWQEAVKWVRLLRDANTADSRILLRARWTGGHGGPSQLDERELERVREWAFLLDRLLGP